MVLLQKSWILHGLFVLILMVITDADPRPTMIGGGGSSGGYGSGGGGLNLNKMIFTVQDARKLFANKMKSLSFSGAAPKKHPPKKQPVKYVFVETYHDPHKGGDDHKGGGYGHDSHGHGSSYSRELVPKKKREDKKSDKREAEWVPVVRSEASKEAPPAKEATGVTILYKRVGDKTENRQGLPIMKGIKQSLEAGGQLKKINGKKRTYGGVQKVQYMYEPKE